jgi:hypothetical protein
MLLEILIPFFRLAVLVIHRLGALIMADVLDEKLHLLQSLFELFRSLPVF